MNKLSEDELQQVYQWVDEIKLSRPKRNIARDFSDGVLMAEVIGHHVPRIIDVHNYSQANAIAQKMYNWNTLQQKVFSQMRFRVDSAEVADIVNARPGAIEAFLYKLMNAVEEFKSSDMQRRSARPHRTVRTKPTRYSDISRPSSERPRGGSGSLASRDAFDGTVEYEEYERLAGEVEAEVQSVVDMGGDPEEELWRDQEISEMRETIKILEMKSDKLKQLLKLKDSRIQTLTEQLRAGY